VYSCSWMRAEATELELLRHAVAPTHADPVLEETT
jgi:hypothetical protein